MFYLFAPPTCRLHALLETCMSSRISPHPALELAHAQALTGKLCGADFPPAAPHGRAAVRLFSAHLVRIGADGNFHRGQAMAIIWSIAGVWYLIYWNHEGAALWDWAFFPLLSLRFFKGFKLPKWRTVNSGVAASQWFLPISHKTRNVFLIMHGVIHLWSYIGSLIRPSNVK